MGTKADSRVPHFVVCFLPSTRPPEGKKSHTTKEEKNRVIPEILGWGVGKGSESCIDAPDFETLRSGILDLGSHPPHLRQEA